MLLTTKVGAAIAATAAASFVAGASLGPSTMNTRDMAPQISSTVQRGAKADRLDFDRRSMDRRIACLSQDWLRLGPECMELFTHAAQDSLEPRSTTIVVRDAPGSSIAIRVPRPESELTFR